MAHRARLSEVPEGYLPLTPAVLVENGRQQLWLCGEKKGNTPLVDNMLDVAPGEQTGTWGCGE